LRDASPTLKSFLSNAVPLPENTSETGGGEGMKLHATAVFPAINITKTS